MCYTTVFILLFISLLILREYHGTVAVKILFESSIGTVPRRRVGAVSSLTPRFDRPIITRYCNSFSQETERKD
jgi:hypothetical protein